MLILVMKCYRKSVGEAYPKAGHNSVEIMHCSGVGPIYF